MTRGSLENRILSREIKYQIFPESINFLDHTIIHLKLIGTRNRVGDYYYYYYYYPIYCTFSACAGKLSPIPFRSLLGLGSVDVERDFTLAHMIHINEYYYYYYYYIYVYSIKKYKSL